MKLRKLLKPYPSVVVKGSKEVEITGICANSKMVAPGNLFIARKGFTHDGAAFIEEAVSAGAAAVLTDIYDPFLHNVVQVLSPKIPHFEGEIAKNFYQSACDRLLLVGVTGTNGKTTIAYLLKHLLDAARLRAGLIGTIHWVIGEHQIPSLNTTPDLITNHKLFYEMVQTGCQAAVMEVSSHGLDQGRVVGLDFDVAIFSNLTLEHLDYHKTMEEYADAKSLLFKGLQGGKAVVNGDDPWAEVVLRGCQAAVFRYGIEKEADLKAEGVRLSAEGTRCTLLYQGQQIAFYTSLIGRFNLYNCLAALAGALACDLPLESAILALQTFKSVPGRLERIANKLHLDIFVDYAHTDDALENVLKTLFEIKKTRIITVFGCGGNREVSKRPKMGAVAEKFSDCVVLTTDNPRQEDPDEIIRQSLAGFKNPARVVVEPDRRQAIEKAIDLALPNDILLIAGKGHETYQVFAHKTIEFDDRKVVHEVCEKLCTSGSSK